MENPKYFLVVTGPPGIGKTYFCAAMLEFLPQTIRSVRVWNEREMLKRLRNGIDEGKGDYLANLQYMVDDELVIIDDIGSSGRTDWREEILMELVDLRYRNGLATILTSNLSREDFFREYNTRIGSRIFAKKNTILDLKNMPDQRSLGN